MNIFSANFSRTCTTKRSLKKLNFGINPIHEYSSLLYDIDFISIFCSISILVNLCYLMIPPDTTLLTAVSRQFWPLQAYLFKQPLIKTSSKNGSHLLYVLRCPFSLRKLTQFSSRVYFIITFFFISPISFALFHVFVLNCIITSAIEENNNRNKLYHTHLYTIRYMWLWTLNL